MEVRLIDPKDDFQPHHAGKVLGTVVRLVQPARHSPAPKSEPFKFLIDRALNQNAGGTGPKLTESSANSSHETDRIFPSPPATYPSYFITKDDSGKEVWWNPKSKSYEVKDGAGKAGRRLYSVGQESVKVIASSTEGTVVDSPAPDSQQNAEMVRTDSGIVIPPSLTASQSAPSHPAPSYCVNNGTVIPLDADHNAGERRSAVVRLHPNVSETVSECDSSAPNHQNAEAGRGSYPQLVAQTQLRVMRKISSSSARPAPNSSEPTDLGTRLSPRDRGLRHILSRFIDVIMEHSAYNDPTKEMTNFGWRKKA